jgi:hypothetical protein
MRRGRWSPNGVRRTAGFVAGVTGRYQALGRAAPRLGMPLATLAARLERSGDPASSATHVVYRPRLQVGITVLVPRVSTTSQLPLAASPLRLAAAAGLERRGHAAADAIAERLRLRETRIETTPQVTITGTAPAPGAVSPPPLPSFPLVSRRAPEAAAAVRTERDRTPPRAPESSATDPARPLLPAEVARLTDEVLQTLDRRIVAQRERIGRR